MKRLQRFLAGCLAALLVTGMTVPAGAVTNTPAPPSRFADTAGHIAEKAIARWADAGVVSGNGDGSFTPDNTITRAEMCRIMTSLFGLRAGSGTRFPDVAADAWYAPYVSACAKAGVVSGYGDGTFGPNDMITWEQAVSMLARGLDIRRQAGDAVPAGCIASDWAVNAVAAMAKYGIPMNLDLRQGIARGYVLYLLDGAVDTYINRPGTHSLTASGGKGVILIAAGDVTLTGKTGAKIVVAQGASPAADKKTDVFVKCSSVGDMMISGDDIIVAVSKDTKYGDTDIAKTSSRSKYIFEEEEKKTAGTGSGGGHKPNRPKPDPKPEPVPDAVTESPDKAAIIARMTDIDPNRFKVVEAPSDPGVEAHPYHFETKSHPFSSMYCSVGNVSELAREYGCGEKEFFMSGLANVYGLHENGVNVPVVKTADADYTTRLLIHYPERAERFSGRVYVDILNASAGYDLEDIWRRSYENMMRSGDIYIGITSKDSSAQALKNFNPERYAALDWCVDNDKIDVDWVLNPGNSENGLFWDMLSQLGTLLKERPEDLFGPDLGAKVKSEGRSYLVGQSQSHFYLNTYLNAFYPYLNDILDGRDIWDGYMGAVGMASQTALSSGVAMTPVTAFVKTDEPYIVIQSGAEANYRLSMQEKGQILYEFPANDADKPMLRVYEAAGAPHADPTAAILPNNYEIAKANTRNAKGSYTGASRDRKNYTGDHVEGDLHLDEFITAALENLDAWSREGRAAPPSVALEPGKDALDNQRGGLRSPKLEAPVASYYPVINNAGIYATEGSMVYLTEAQLEARYPGGFDQYLSEFKAQADALLNAGYLIRADYEKLLEYSRSASILGRRTEDIVETLTSVPRAKDVTPVGNMETMFGSTAMSISAKYGEAWDQAAPEWAKSLELDANDDHIIRLPGGAIDYAEKEFFVSGDANLYTVTPDNRFVVKESGLPYTNRIIVRTPADPNQFTGRVYVDILNASDKFDSEALWRRANSMIMRSGAAYIGVTSKPVNVKTLHLFHDRYDEVSWASPNTYLHTNFNAKDLPAHLDGSYHEKESELPGTDIGLIWDIVSQTGMLAKENPELLFGDSSKPIYTYLFGQSQSGFYVNTFTRFQKLLEDEDAPLPYDGMMTMVGTLMGGMYLNQSDKIAPATPGAVKTFPEFGGMTVAYVLPNDMKTPVMTVTSENDRNDVFCAEGKNYRYYELAGVPHSDNNTPIFPTNDILRSVFLNGIADKNINMNYISIDETDPEAPVYGVKPDGSDINSNMFIRGLLSALDEWAVYGTTPPPSLAIEKGGTQGVSNAEGGLRSPQIDEPMNIYAKNGTMQALPNETLLERYPNAGDYKDAFMERLQKLAAERCILPVDVDYMTAYADRMEEKLAKLRGESEDLFQKVQESLTNELTEIQEVEYDPAIDYHPDEADTEHTHPFNSMYCSNGEIRLEDRGYTEKEFFISGKANLYQNLAEDGKTLRQTVTIESDAPLDYTTRVLVRYPEGRNAPAFNGNVYIDLLNMTAGCDNEDLWRRSYEYLMEGSAYVGITYHGTGVKALKQWDGERYDELVWPAENGIAWDVISQVGAMLKSDEGKRLLGDNQPARVFLTGQSSSGFYLNTYLRTFYPYIRNALDGEPIFDGYVSVVGGALGVPVKNPDHYAVGSITDGRFAATGEPFVAILSEYEASNQSNAMFGYQRTKDTDSFRLYEVAGAPHYDPTSPILPNADEIERAGSTPKDFRYKDGDQETDLNLDEFVTGALENIAKWADDPRFEMPSGQNQWMTAKRREDAYGNTIGGLRHPKLEAPLARYIAMGRYDKMGQTGVMRDLAWEQLVSRYGKGADPAEAEIDALFAQYKKEFAAAAESLCEEGLIREREKDALIAWSEDQRERFEAAKERFDQEQTKTAELLEEDIPPIEEDGGLSSGAPEESDPPAPEENAPEVSVPDEGEQEDGAPPADETGGDAPHVEDDAAGGETAILDGPQDGGRTEPAAPEAA